MLRFRHCAMSVLCNPLEMNQQSLWKHTIAFAYAQSMNVSEKPLERILSAIIRPRMICALEESCLGHSNYS